jgi:hypothetical protein
MGTHSQCIPRGRSGAITAVSCTSGRCTWAAVTRERVSIMLLIDGVVARGGSDGGLTGLEHESLVGHSSQTPEVIEAEDGLGKNIEDW